MPMYETHSENGQITLRLKVHALVESDFQNYGALEHSDLELDRRAHYHIQQLQEQLPTPQTVLTDDFSTFTRIVVQQYATIYKGLLVAYIGFKEPYAVSLVPRYTTTVNFSRRDELQHNLENEEDPADNRTVPNMRKQLTPHIGVKEAYLFPAVRIKLHFLSLCLSYSQVSTLIPPLRGRISLQTIVSFFQKK